MRVINAIRSFVNPTMKLISRGNITQRMAIFHERLHYQVLMKHSYYLHFRNYCSIQSEVSEENEETEKVEDLSEAEINEITEGDPVIQEALKILQYEISVMREQNYVLPRKLEKDHWIELLSQKTYKIRAKYLKFLFKKEILKIKAKRKKVQKPKKQVKTVADEYPLKYGLKDNTYFMRIYPSAIINLCNARLLGASMFGQHLVFDCSYEDYMTSINKSHCLRQLASCFGVNRKHRLPFHIKICNIRGDNTLVKNFIKSFCKSESYKLWDYHNESYLDVYSHDRLVYLSPHAKSTLYRLNPDDVYIIGAYVDRGTGGKASLSKAKSENIRMAKLPIDDFLLWKKGSKSLPINTVLSILLDFRLYNDWKIAFRHIPQRFATIV